jgi:hypothetical protein
VSYELPDEQRGELRVAAPLRDAHEILAIGLDRIGLHALVEAGIVALGPGNEAVELRDMVVREAEDRAREVRVAAALAARRLLKDEHVIRH